MEHWKSLVIPATTEDVFISGAAEDPWHCQNLPVPQGTRDPGRAENGQTTRGQQQRWAMEQTQRYVSADMAGSCEEMPPIGRKEKKTRDDGQPMVEWTRR